MLIEMKFMIRGDKDWKGSQVYTQFRGPSTPSSRVILCEIPSERGGQGTKEV